MKLIRVDLAMPPDKPSVAVIAEQYGPFAIHRTALSMGGLGQTYTVTHIATGCAVASCLDRRDKAVTLARKLTSARLNWGFRKPHRMPTRTKQRGLEIIRAVRGW